jgi:hypothetical protein
VEKEVVGAVKAALRQAKLTSAGGVTASASQGESEEKFGRGDWEKQGYEGKLKKEARDDAVQPVPASSLVSTLPPHNGGPVKSPCALPETPSPRKKRLNSAKSPPVKSPGSLFGGEGSPCSPTRIKTPAGSPGASRLGGLLMACISPPRGAHAQGSEEEEGDVGGGQEKCAKPEIIREIPEEKTKLYQGVQDECAKSEAGTLGKQQQSEQGQLGENVENGGQRSGVSTPVSGVKSGGRSETAADRCACAKSEVGTPGKKQENEQREPWEIAAFGGQRSGVPSPVCGGESDERPKQPADRFPCAAESPEKNLETGQGEVEGNVSSDGGESGVFSPGSGAKSGGHPSKAAQRYSHAADSSESDDEQGHVTSAFLCFSPSKSPVKTPCKSPAYASPSKCGVPGVKEPGVGELSPQPAATPGRKVTEDLAVEKSDGAEGKLVGEMVNRLVGLSEEQRNAVGSVVATRGFGGFLENSPFASRQGFAFSGFIPISRLSLAFWSNPRCSNPCHGQGRSVWGVAISAVYCSTLDLLRAFLQSDSCQLRH